MRSLWPFFGLSWKPLAAGEDRQDLERPGLVLLVDLLGLEQLEEVPDGEGDDVVVALEVAVVLFEAAQDPGDVLGHARFLGNDEGLRHASPLCGVPSA